MMEYRRKILAPLTVLTVYLASVQLLSQAQDSDALWPTTKWAGIVLLAAFIWGAIMSAGSLAAKLLCLDEECAVFSLPLGSLVFCLISLILTSLHLAGAHFQTLWLGLAFLPYGGLYLQNPKRESAPLPWGIWFFVFVLLVLTCLALSPQGHPDPLYYHLLSARRWYEAGHLQFFPSHPLLFQSGLWEMLYFWPLQLAAPAFGQDLIAQQILAQLLHLFIGFTGCYFVLVRILEKQKLPLPQASALFLLLQIFFLESAVTAKSDFGILLWGTTSLLLVCTKEKSWRLELAALFLGFAASNKWPSLYGFLPLLAWLIWLKRERAVYIGAAFALGLAPVLLRNFIFSGSPLFPATMLSAPLLSESDQLLFASYSQAWRHVSFASFLQNILTLLRGQPINATWIFLPFVWKQKRPSLGEFWQSLLLTTITMILIGAWCLHPALSWRITGLTPILTSLLGMVLLIKSGFADKIPEKVRTLLAPSLLAIYLLFASSWLPPTQFFRQPAATIREFRAGDAMAWLRMNRAGDGRIAFGGNAELYYMEGLPAVDIDMDPRLEHALAQAKTTKAMVDFLRSENFRWFVETAGPVPHGHTAGYFAKLAEKYGKECISFYSPNARVWDLDLVSKRIALADFVEPEHPSDRVILPQQK